MSLAAVVGERLGRWTLSKKLGSGGFGSAWLASDDNGQEAALKILGGPPGGEARALARICHPAVPALLDAQGGTKPYLCMELAPGRTLTRMIKAGRAPDRAAITVLAVLADALSAVHIAGMSHGDMKPDNVVVSSVAAGKMMIVDFGVAGTGEGGTLLYAAPERLAGAGPTPENDVYSLGLSLWEMLHGQLPWAELGPSMALLKRRGPPPDPSEGPEWLQELVVQMLAFDPANRPTAANVADACAAHGAKIPAPGPDLLRIRATSVHIPSVGVEQEVAKWKEEGGALAIVGTPGSGRSHTLDRVTIDLKAAGWSVLRLVATGEPWGSIRQALASPTLPNEPQPLPGDADPGQRATTAAAKLEDRCPESLFLVVDDYDTFDDGTLRTLAALAGRGQVRLIVAGDEAPEWSTATAQLDPLDEAGVHELVCGVLGDGAALDELARRLYLLTDGLPGIAVDLLVAACRAQVLVRRNQRWMVAAGWLEDLLAGGDLAGPAVTPHSDEARVGSLVALARTHLPVAELPRMADLPAARVGVAIQKLARSRLLQIEDGNASVASRVTARRLERVCPDPVRVHKTLLAWMDAQSVTDPFREAWHVVGAQDTLRAIAKGPELLMAAGHVDREEAARLAAALWKLAPEPALVAPLVDALAMVGKVDDAVAAAESTDLTEMEPADAVAISTALGRAWLQSDGRESRALDCVREARALLGEDTPSLALAQVEAQALFRTEQPELAAKVASAAANTELPADEHELDRWLNLRGVWAQSIHKTGQLDQAIEILEAVPEHAGKGRPARALLSGTLGRLLWHAGRIRDAATAIAQAGAQGSGLSALDRARMLNNAGLASFLSGQRLRALELWEDALLLFERLEAPLEQIRVSTNLCVGYREAGRWERGRQAGEQAVRWAADQTQPELEAMAAGNLGDLFLAQDQLDSARSWYQHARKLANAHKLSGELVELAKRDAELAVLDRSPKAMRLCGKAMRKAEGAGERLLLAKTRALKAVCHARRGETDRMKVELDAAVEDLREAGAAGDLAEVRLLAAEAQLTAGNAREARTVCDKVIVYANEVDHVPLRIRAEKLLASMDRDSADTDQVRQLLELAVDVSQERDLDQLLGKIANAGLKLLDGERAFVVLVEDGAPVVHAIRTRSGETEGAKPSYSVLDACIQSRKEVIAADISERGDLRNANSVLLLDLHSAMCVPMIDGDEVTGAIYVDSRMASEEHLTRSALFMRALASHAAVAVANAHQLAELRGHAQWTRGVAHDMKSPVSSMLMLADGLDPHDTQAVKEAVRDLKVLSRKALAMAQGFLDGKQKKAAVKGVNLSAFAEESLRLLNHRASGEGVELLLDIAPGLRVVGDPSSLDRIVGNIVGNAIKYSDPGGRIWVTLEADDGEAKFVVTDEGGGIPPEAIATIWGADVQAAGARAGNGVGLGVVKGMVEEMGGRVDGTNHPTYGAMFTIWLPLTGEPARQGAAQGPAAGAGRDGDEQLPVTLA
jgi:signal transduction histidine kinase/tetratricopeptide (TPR) repeat protein